MLKEFTKDPAAVLAYGLNLKDWLAPGDLVAEATAELLDATGVEKVDPNPTIENDGTAVAIRLRGGVTGDRVRVRITWTTAAGDTDARTFLVSVKSR